MNVSSFQPSSQILCGQVPHPGLDPMVHNGSVNWRETRIPVLLALLATLSLTAACTKTVTGKAPARTNTPVTAAPTTSTTALSLQAQNQQLKDAVQAYSNDYLGGNGAGAFALLSSHCQLTIGLQQETSLASVAKTVYGVLPIISFTVDSDSGREATVSYTYSVTTLDQTQQPWVLEGGSWKYNHC